MKLASILVILILIAIVTALAGIEAVSDVERSVERVKAAHAAAEAV